MSYSSFFIRRDVEDGKHLTLTANAVPHEMPTVSDSTNAVSLELTLNDGVVPNEVMEAYQESLTETFDDVKYHTVPDPRDYDTVLSLDISVIEAERLANKLLDHVKALKTKANDVAAKMLMFKNAQLACATGAIGTLRIKQLKNRATLSGATGAGRYSLTYISDHEDQVMFDVEDVELFIPFDGDMQMEWLRSLVGGNHQYTTDIKIALDNFSFQEITDAALEKYNEDLANATAPEQ